MFLLQIPLRVGLDNNPIDGFAIGSYILDFARIIVMLFTSKQMAESYSLFSYVNGHLLFWPLSMFVGPPPIMLAPLTLILVPILA